MKTAQNLTTADSKDAFLNYVHKLIDQQFAIWEAEKQQSGKRKKLSNSRSIKYLALEIGVHKETLRKMYNTNSGYNPSLEICFKVLQYFHKKIQFIDLN